jgi:hypothetical protein
MWPRAQIQASPVPHKKKSRKKRLFEFKQGGVKQGGLPRPEEIQDLDYG